MEEELLPLRCSLPFESPTGWEKWTTGQGRCIQGNNTDQTHHGCLRHAFDFKLRPGSRVLAARDGVVVHVRDHFREGGPRERLLPRSNFVALRHSDGTYTRYIHLMPGGALVRVGQEVRAGQLIALSGNTGFTSEPHLHFDAVSLLPQETSELRFLYPGDPVLIPSIAAIFSGPLSIQNQIVAPLVYLSSGELLTAMSAYVHGTTVGGAEFPRPIGGTPPDLQIAAAEVPLLADVVVLIDRGGAGGQQTFAEAAATAAGAVALTHSCRCVGVVVANDRAGHELFAMAPPRQDRQGPRGGDGLVGGGQMPRQGESEPFVTKETVKSIFPVESVVVDPNFERESRQSYWQKQRTSATLWTDECEDADSDVSTPPGWCSSSSSSSSSSSRSWSAVATEMSSYGSRQAFITDPVREFTNGTHKKGSSAKCFQGRGCNNKFVPAWALPNFPQSSPYSSVAATERGRRVKFQEPFRAPFPVVMVSQESGKWLKDALSTAAEANNASSRHSDTERDSEFANQSDYARGGYIGAGTTTAATAGLFRAHEGNRGQAEITLQGKYYNRPAMSMPDAATCALHGQPQTLAPGAATSPEGVILGLRACEHCPAALLGPGEESGSGGRWEAKPLLYGAQTLPVTFAKVRRSNLNSW